MAYRHFASALFILGVLMAPDAPAETQAVDAAAVARLVKDGAVLLDVRTQEEWDEGHIKGARLVPWQNLVATSPGLPADKNTPIVTYCRSGSRSQLAVQKLRGLGYTRAVAMTQGGFEELAGAGMKVEK